MTSRKQDNMTEFGERYEQEEQVGTEQVNKKSQIIRKWAPGRMKMVST